ncbi:MFS transporter [Frondihabitans australicus]|uniref:Putative MFS family arabinose efflux permease n=1 Tax=Frondihabitans australicus TaxID=386892 RepID=A0A495IDV9_9MICO|nr:MFS transporter [Frondihabitans australicus]RKR73511.1 putative MFS family arabinose efflux permease [Frondihabitans australicus]
MTVIEQSYASRIVTARLGILAGALFVVGTNAFVIAGLLPQIARGLGTTETSVGYTITLYSIIVAVVSPALSVGLARIDRTHLMTAGLAVIAVGTAVTAVSTSLGMFEVGRVLAAIGGAALVPAATAAAPTLLPADQRGRALAIAALGFTFATALGSPVGTALAGVGGWRLPLGALAILGALLAVAIGVLVRDVPLGAAIGLRARLATLRGGAMVLTLVSALLLTAGFNIVYIFVSPVTAASTSGSSGLLAILLLLFGLGGVVGTNLSGRLTDRLGSRAMVAIGLGGEVVVLGLVPVLAGSYALLAVAFFVWGVLAFGAVVPVQHRLVSIDPATAGIALSWYSTAMYVGIALAPVLGGFELAGSGASIAIPLTGAALALVALVAFAVGSARRRPRPHTS